ncbi:amino acid ABC transporter substrate-binding protein [Polymorphum gilvum]|uniref:ABC-type branched-chain amino acid transporter periplasmic amino acid-binding protein n=1 Tax=Polymorphum gilvum (strain LMG 25793 / CGMCC 1.9160 / SL003B-26A1) TaxID=991905 RepID=F2IYM6_POLGS|nr:amino acid ABC transporter substrate-binding protein [Polymorphum gilvum]ADZ69473.1 ABC-type branched-chain amino acid transporter periplasmic amino acid-binding protein [Polymorphum gilvum SL003B-26A1]
MRDMLKTSLVTAAVCGLLGGTAQAADPIKIGASLPLTGNFSVSGQKHKEGYELCVDQINAAGGLIGRPLELIVSDNRSDTETAINQAERLINVDKADVIFGTFSSKLTFPVSSVLEKYGKVHPVPAGGALRIWEQGHKHAFYFQQNAAEYVGETLVSTIRDVIPADQRPKKAALVNADDFFANAIAAGLLGQKVTNPGGGLVADLAPGYLKESEIEVVYTETWPEEGFSDWLNLANSIKRSGADLVIGLTASAEEAVQLTRALKTVRADIKLLYLSQGTQAEFHEGLGNDAEGVMVHSSWHEEVPFVGTLNGKDYTNQQFLADFKAKYGKDADEDSAIPFAVCQGVVQAIEAIGTTDNAKLSEWMHARTKAEPVRTILGPFAWDERGLPIDRPFLMAQWQAGKLNFIYPTDEFAGVAQAIHPKPAWK